MNALRSSLADYLAMRRALGYELERAGKLLGQFLAYLEARGEQRVTTKLALAWATLPAGGGAWHAQRLSAVRGFRGLPARAGPDRRGGRGRSAARSPAPRDALPLHRSEIAALIAAAATLSTPHRVATYRTLFGLLAATGMRVGEAIALDHSDFDRRHGVLVVRAAKLGKSRELPLHLTAVDALTGYLARSDRPSRPPEEPALLVSTAGTRLLVTNVQATFRVLRARAAIQATSASRRPTIHGLRHSFAVRTILDGYRTDSDVGPRMALLATYLGHVDPGKTYWLFAGRTGADGARRRAPGAPPRSPLMSALAPTLQAFFTERLVGQQDASQHTIAAYRATMRLLLRFAAQRVGKQPSKLDLEDLDAPLIGAFLDYLEHERGCSPRTRNARLAAIHSLYRFAHSVTQSTPRRSSESSRSRPSATSEHSSPSSPKKRSTRCSTPPTELPRSPDATTRCCYSPSKRGCAPPS